MAFNNNGGKAYVAPHLRSDVNSQGGYGGNAKQQGRKMAYLERKREEFSERKGLGNGRFMQPPGGNGFFPQQMPGTAGGPTNRFIPTATAPPFNPNGAFVQQPNTVLPMGLPEHIYPGTPLYEQFKDIFEKEPEVDFRIDEYEEEADEEVWTPESAAARKQLGRTPHPKQPDHAPHREQFKAQPVSSLKGQLEIDPAVLMTYPSAPLRAFNTGRAVYRVVRVIQAAGLMSDGVREVLHPNGEKRIEKRLKVTDDKQRDRVRAEKEVLQQIVDAGGSPHINLMFECYWPVGSTHCALILERCDGGSLAQVIGNHVKAQSPFQEGFLWHTLLHLASALSMCHLGIRNPLFKKYKLPDWDTICHLDIKPANVFVKQTRGIGFEDDIYPTIVLGDFGCAVKKSDIEQNRVTKHGIPYGTFEFFPPENTPKTPNELPGRYGRPTDIWQLGAIIHCMARLRQVPDPSKFGPNVCGPGWSKALNKIVDLCMHPNWEKRPTAVDVAEKMREWKKTQEENFETGDHSGEARNHE